MAKLSGQISQRDFGNDIALAEMQLDAIKLATNKTDLMLAQYEQKENTLGGRYICADTFKELFPSFEDKENRARANNAVHNAAAVLSATQFDEILKRTELGRNEAIFITGIPGSGKTSTVVNTFVSDSVKVLFEGQLSNPAAAIPKIQKCIDAGLKVKIYAVHLPAEQALDNTFKRFNEYGRGASIGIMAEIQGNLPRGLASIKEKFQDNVSIAVIDKTNQNKVVEEFDDVLAVLSVGTKEEILSGLGKKILNDKASDIISSACFEQAKGSMSMNELMDISKNNIIGGFMETQKERVIVMNKSHLLESEQNGKWVTKKVTPAPDGMKPGIYLLHTAKAAEEGKTYEGVVVHRDSKVVYQKSGQSMIKHDVATFQKMPALGENLSIKLEKGQSQTTGNNAKKVLKR